MEGDTDLAGADRQQRLNATATCTETGARAVSARLLASMRVLELASKTGLRLPESGPPRHGRTNLPQVKTGDVVHIACFEAVAVDAKKTDAPLAVSETVEENSAPPGEKPAGVVMRKVPAITNVLDVNNANQSIRVQGPRANIAEVKLRDPSDFEHQDRRQNRSHVLRRGSGRGA